MRHSFLVASFCALALAGCVSETVDSSGTPVTEAPAPGGPTPVDVAHAQIRTIIRNLKEQDGAELLRSLQVLVKMRELTLDPIAEMLPASDTRTRANLCYVLGGIGGVKAAGIATTCLRDGDKTVRFEAGAALVAMGEPAGYETVVTFLSDSDRKYRYKAIEALREATRQDFGYDFNAGDGVRNASVSRWNAWLAERRSGTLDKK